MDKSANLKTDCIQTGSVRFTRAATRRESGATSSLSWRWGEVGEVSHLGLLSQPAHVNMKLVLHHMEKDALDDITTL